MSGGIGTEKAYALGEVQTQEVGLACEIKPASFRITYLANGQVRLELPNSTYDILEWTLPNGTRVQGNPIVISCGGLLEYPGPIRLDVYSIDASLPNGRRLRCTGRITVTCACGKVARTERELIRTVQGQTWRLRVAIWVQPGEAGSSMNYLRRRSGLWVPSHSGGVCTDIAGRYIRERPDQSCGPVAAFANRCLGGGTFPTTIFARQPDISRIFNEPGSMNSGHLITTQGEQWGFGITVPRLILN